MKCTLENLDRVVKFIMEQHADNSEHGEFDDESDLVDVIQRVVTQIEDESSFMCNSCHDLFPREEMDFDVNDSDLCKNCNYVSFNDAPYGGE
jgi:biotin synthase-related radical SAM superfamily protein